MSEKVFRQPTDAQLIAFVAGDSIAIDEVARLILPQLSSWAIVKNLDLPVQEVQSTVNQVLAEICRKCGRYDPGRSSLTTYVINLLKLRLRDLYKDAAALHFISEFENQYENVPELPYNIPDRTVLIARKLFFEEVARELDPIENAFLTLMRKGEKCQVVFTEVLQHYNRPCSAKDVKSTKERLQRKLRNIALDKGYELTDLIE